MHRVSPYKVKARLTVDNRELAEVDFRSLGWKCVWRRAIMRHFKYVYIVLDNSDT